MAIFSYVAKNTTGTTTTGTVDSRSQEQAVALLKNQGLYVISISQKRDNVFEQMQNSRGVPQSEVVTFTRQFSTMISAGLPISRALEVLANQTTNVAFKKVLYDILRSIEGGSSLSSSMAKYPDIFPTTYHALVKAGESSGKLDAILKRLAENMEADRELNSKFTGALVYPAIVVFAMVGVFIVLMVFVIPKLSEMYTSMGVELPFVTRVMIGISAFMVKYIYIVLIGIVGAVFAGKAFFKSEDGKYITSEISVRVPVFGKIIKQKDYSQFSRTLSLLMGSAVPIVESLTIVSTVITNPTFRAAILDAARQIEKGNTLSSYFRSNPLFPPLLSQMSGVGEETGKMDEVLDRVANYYDGEVNHMVKGLSAALEPIILVVLGAGVGFLIISIITPIYKITSAI